MENKYQGNYQQPLNQQPMNRQQLLQQQRMEREERIRKMQEEKGTMETAASYANSGYQRVYSGNINEQERKPTTNNTVAREVATGKMSKQLSDNYEQPLSTIGWIGTLFVLMIPLVNIVMLLIWGFGKGNRGRSNFCKAYMIFFVLLVAIIGFSVYYVLVDVLGFDLKFITDMLK